MSSNCKNKDTAKKLDCFCDFYTFFEWRGANATVFV